MTHEQRLRQSLLRLEFNEAFSEAVIELSDGSRLCFCHNVAARWAKAVGPTGAESEGRLAAELVQAITRFRLNSKHLDIEFADASRWERRFRDG